MIYHDKRPLFSLPTSSPTSVKPPRSSIPLAISTPPFLLPQDHVIIVSWNTLLPSLLPVPSLSPSLPLSLSLPLSSLVSVTQIHGFYRSFWNFGLFEGASDRALCTFLVKNLGVGGIGTFGTPQFSLYHVGGIAMVYNGNVALLQERCPCTKYQPSNITSAPRYYCSLWTRMIPAWLVS